MREIKTKIDEDVLWAGINSRVKVRAFHDWDGIHYKVFYEVSPEMYNILMAIVDRNGRLMDYIDNYLANEMKYHIPEPMMEREYVLDVGAVLFLETLLLDEDGDHYIAEPTQFYMLIDPSYDSVKTVTRRGTKSFTDKVVAFRNCVATKKYGVLVTEQSWTIAKQYLDDIYLWYENNPLIQDWSGGRLRKDAEHHIEFGNRSFIMCYTASNLVNVRGAGVNMQINDEKSAYTSNTAVSRIIARGQKKKKGRRRTLFRTSGTPLGSGTEFHKDQVNPDKWQYYAPMVCPMGFKKPVCYDCEYFTLTKYRKGELHTLASLECSADFKYDENGLPIFDGTYKRIPDDRFTFDELLEDFKALGKTLWQQEYMCATQDYSGNAIPLELINMFFDDTMDIIYESDMRCCIGLDFGLTENHNSAFSVVGIDENGKLRNLKTHVFPIGTPYRTRTVGGQLVVGVIETVLAQFNNYPNIYKIVADASGVGKPLVEHDMIDMARQKNGFSNIVPYKFVGQSKEFLGKSQLWFSLIRPTLETGRIKSYMDRRLYSEMRAWQVDYDPTKQARPQLHPPKAGAVQSDDAWISLMLAIWGILHEQPDQARNELIIEGIPAHEAYGVSPFEVGGY